MPKFKNIFRKCDSYLFKDTNEKPTSLDVTGIIIPGKISWEELKDRKRLSRTWIIKFSPYMNYEGNFNFKFIDSYRGFSGSQDLYVILLGGQYFIKQHQNGNVIKRNNIYSFKNIRNYLNTVEIQNLISTSTNQRLEQDLELKKLFYRRYFTNQEFFSMRNMSFEFDFKEIKNEDLNIALGDNNIFGKDLVNIYDNPLSEDNKFKIKKKILLYFFDTLFYCIHYDSKYQSHYSLNFALEEMKDILRQEINETDELKEHEIDYFDINYKLGGIKEFNTEENDILEKILKKLEIVGYKIALGEDKYKNTRFYTFIKLPFYDDIRNNK